MEDTYLDLHYPKGGVDVSRPFSNQPWRQGPRRADGEPTRIYTSADSENCRSYDPLTQRFRGGSRVGLSRYITNPLVAGWMVQHLNTVVGVREDVAEQSSLLGRVVTGVAVSQGKVFWFEPGVDALTEATNNSATTPPLNFTGVMMSAPNNQKLYIVDGVHYRYFVPITNTVETWTETTSGGTMPSDGQGNTARLIATYRGSTVLSGLLEDSQNWFISRTSNPHDFDYGASPASDPTRAVAGNNSRLGFIGDIVTALIAYSDDIMLFGGNTSIYAMRGHPNSGGEIDLVTSSIGVAWGEAFTQDPRGNVYFMSNTGAIYGMAPGGKPEKISTAIDQLVTNINTGEKTIRLVWNEQQKGMHVFCTTIAGATQSDRHFFWDAQSNAWNPDRFAEKRHNPIAACTIDGSTPEDRVVLVGGWDGYIRKFSPSATTDDGKPINWYVWMGPLLTKDFDEIVVKSIQAIMGADSGTVNYEVHHGRTAEEALASAAIRRGNGSLTAGRSKSMLASPIAGHAIYIKLYGTDRFAMEAIRVTLSGNLSKLRKRY